MKSLIAEPSLKNSGLAATSNSSFLITDILFLIWEPVPTGTVDLVTIIEPTSALLAISSAAA